jgi:hypothetical protein
LSQVVVGLGSELDIKLVVDNLLVDFVVIVVVGVFVVVKHVIVVITFVY